MLYAEEVAKETRRGSMVKGTEMKADIQRTIRGFTISDQRAMGE